MNSWLLHSGQIVAANGEIHSAVLIVDGQIVDFPSQAVSADRVTHLEGACVTAGFVDAHVHLTATGQLLSGVDVRGAQNWAQVLRAIGEAHEKLPTGHSIVGHGWDDTNFDETPSFLDIHGVAPGRLVYLTRIDVHSALISQELANAVPGLIKLSGWINSSVVSQGAHGAARSVILSELTAQQRRQFQSAAIRRCAELGIVSVHENGGPVVSSAADLQLAIELGQHPENPEVIGYWGKLFGAAEARDLGAHGVAGDLFVDGALGSHTACLHTSYADAAHQGAQYVSPAELVMHFKECRALHMQAGVHAIGDRAIADTLAAMQEVAIASGSAGEPHVSDLRWRIEHLEMPSTQILDAMRQLSVIASVQPMFDALWGGQDGMYERRLGAERARLMNPFAELHARGIPLAFGSDSPVTSLGPWAAVHAAVLHHQASQRLSHAVAFAAHTRGAAYAAPSSTVRARIAVGEPADLAIWGAVDAPDGNVLAALTERACDSPASRRALATIRSGNLIHDGGFFS